YNIFQQWFFYMRNGYLPWNALGINENWYENVLQTLASDYNAVESLRKEIHENSRMLRRIILQHSEKFLVALTEILTAESQATLPGAISEMQAIVKIVGSSIFLPGNNSPGMTGENNLPSQLWQMILTLAARPDLHWSSGKIVYTILEAWIRNESMLHKIRDALPGMLSFTEPYLHEIEIKLKASPSAVCPEPEITGEILFERKTEKSSAIEAPRSAEDESGLNKTLEEEGIFLSNAGLVLLHPFLSSFFNRLGLLEDGRFIDPASQHKALHLLHYLATGKTEAAEFELQMAKTLCAFPSSGVTEMSVELNAAEIGEAGDLLIACIQQWEVLKNTSAAGLQESFLQRNGKLFSKNGRIQLEVEKKSIDVLLDYLPWNLSLIRLPWMREVLNVNWR
ncbi:MAG TPA: contractile injection system tape measure protein, partial [Puia sp.]